MSLTPLAEEGAASAAVATSPSVPAMVPWASRARLRGGPPACEGAARVVRVMWSAHMRAREGFDWHQESCHPATHPTAQAPTDSAPGLLQACSRPSEHTGWRNDRALSPLTEVLVAAAASRMLLALRPADRMHARRVCNTLVRGAHTVHAQCIPCTCSVCRAAHQCIVIVHVHVHVRWMRVCICMRPRVLPVGARTTLGAAAFLISRHLSDADTSTRCDRASGARSGTFTGSTTGGGGGSCCLG